MTNQRIQKIGLLIEEQKLLKDISNRMISNKLGVTEQAVSKNLKKIIKGKNCGIQKILELADAVGLEKLTI